MPLSLLLVFCAAFTAQANPGQTLLYGFKQAVQKAPLAFIRNPDVRAAKEIELSEKTLNETEAFLSSNTDSSTQASVVANLTKQTSETLASVKDVAKENAISGKNSELLNKLVVIAQKQDQLVNAVKTTQDQPEASTTLTQGKNESTKTIAEVNNLVATVNEQVLANLKEVTPEPKVKGAETTKPAVTEKPKTEKTVSHTTSPAADSETAADPNQTDDSGQVSGNFILEYPTDQ